MKNWIKQVAVVLAVAVFGLGVAGMKAGAVTLTDGSELGPTSIAGVTPNSTPVSGVYTPDSLLDIVVSVTVNGLGNYALTHDLDKVLWGITNATLHFAAGSGSTGTGTISFTTSSPFTIAFATPGVSKNVGFTWYVTAAAAAVPSVPLPAGGLLLLTGLGGLVAARRRKA